MNLSLIAFTAQGTSLAKTLADALTGQGDVCGVFAPADLARAHDISDSGALHDWVAAQFAGADGLIFVGACGIAVRAIAPFLRGKDVDPAVVVLDQSARFSIALLSGHLGGANALASSVAALCGAAPVITTATDLCGVFAVDVWAREQGLALLDTERIKLVSGRLLAGEPVGFACDFPVGTLPPGLIAAPAPVGISVSLDTDKRPFANTLRLVPRRAALGIGCRRGTSLVALRLCALAALEEATVPLSAVEAVCTISLKENEPALRAFCEEQKLPLRVFTAEQLNAVPGTFTASSFVQTVTGVDNVCERAACALGGTLVCRKFSQNGVTAAVAIRPFDVAFGKSC